MKLVFENISKLYGDFPALSGVNLSLDNGVYGLLGPNGAGKTTLMRIMTDLLKPSTGRVLLDGKDIAVLGADFRRRLGYLPQDFGFYPNYTAEQYLLYIARLKGLTRFEAKKQTGDLLEMVGLYEKRNQKMKGLSGGQRQRVGIAQALLGDPDILIITNIMIQFQIIVPFLENLKIFFYFTPDFIPKFGAINGFLFRLKIFIKVPK